MAPSHLSQEGVVVHLFPKWRMAELRKWPTPEILSKSLEEVVMQLLALGWRCFSRLSRFTGCTFEEVDSVVLRLPHCDALSV